MVELLTRPRQAESPSGVGGGDPQDHEPRPAFLAPIQAASRCTHDGGAHPGPARDDRVLRLRSHRCGIDSAHHTWFLQFRAQRSRGRPKHSATVDLDAARLTPQEHLLLEFAGTNLRAAYRVPTSRSRPSRGGWSAEADRRSGIRGGACSGLFVVLPTHSTSSLPRSTSRTAYPQPVTPADA